MSSQNNHQGRNKTALILSGGGARAAYQVGVLKAIGELLPRSAGNPFPIICGASAGAINSAVLAAYASSYRIGMRRLESVWSNFRTEHIYRTDWQGLLRNGWRVMRAIIKSSRYDKKPVALFDNQPLRQLLNRVVPLHRVQDAINDGHLYALCVTASGYTSGESVSFYQGVEEVKPWQRYHRLGCRTTINLKHLLASSAIPLIFPAIKVNREYFGDGSVRFLAPISPALHLGADQVLVIGVDPLKDTNERKSGRNYPTIAEIAGHVLDSVFIDSLDSDLERLHRINRTVSLIPDEILEQHNVKLRTVKTLVIAPSRDLNSIAGRHVDALPSTMRFLMRRVGITGERGATILSYLLFESVYTQELIQLGYHDAMAQAEEIRNFFSF